MKSLSPSPENCRRNGVIGLGLVPGHGPAVINIRISHRGLRQYEVAVPSNSNFGYLKSIISHCIGLKPETYKLIFGGIEKEDDEDLQVAGVMNNSEVLLMEVAECEQKIPEEVQESNVVSKGEDAVAEVRKEVDKLEQQVLELQAVVDSGNKVDDKKIIYLTEMLMRQLLKLDGIEAEGEGKVQRKMEVRRVQSIVQTLDTLKARNSTSSSNTHKNVSEATQSRAFEPGFQSVDTSSPRPSSYPSPSHVPHFAPPTVPSSNFSTVPYCVPSHMPNFTPSALPFSTHSSMPYYDPCPVPSFIPSTLPSFMPSPMPYYDPSRAPYFTPSTLPSSAPSPAPYYAPSNMPSSAPFSMPPSSNVTQNWKQFE